MEPREPDPPDLSEELDTGPDHDLSPELILVSEPEAARAARARLPEISPTDERIAAMLAAGPGEPPVGTPPPPAEPTGWDLFSKPAPELRREPAPAPAPTPTPTPVAERPAGWSGRRVLKLVAAAAILAVAGYYANAVWDRNAPRRLGPSFITPATAVGTATSDLPPTTTQATPTTRRHTIPTPPKTTTAHLPAISVARTTTRVKTVPTAPPRVTTTSRRVTTTRHATTVITPSTTTITTRTTTKPGAIAPSREFAWPPAASAVGYLVRFSRGRKTVLQLTVRFPRATVPRGFEFTPGLYRWVVLPELSRTPPIKYGPAIVDSTFTVAA